MMRQLSKRAGTVNAGQQCDHLWFLAGVLLPAIGAPMYELWRAIPAADRLDFIGMMLMGEEL